MAERHTSNKPKTSTVRRTRVVLMSKYLYHRLQRCRTTSRKSLKLVNKLRILIKVALSFSQVLKTRTVSQKQKLSEAKKGLTVSVITTGPSMRGQVPGHLTPEILPSWGSTGNSWDRNWEICTVIQTCIFGDNRQPKMTPEVSICEYFLANF